MTINDTAAADTNADHQAPRQRTRYLRLVPSAEDQGGEPPSDSDRASDTDDHDLDGGGRREFSLSDDERIEVLPGGINYVLVDSAAAIEGESPCCRVLLDRTLIKLVGRGRIVEAARAAGIDGDEFEQMLEALPVNAEGSARSITEVVMYLMNGAYAFVLVGGSSRILDERPGPAGERHLQISTVKALKEWHANKLLIVGRTSDNEPNFVNPFDLWLNNCERREFRGLTFAPDRDTPEFYNLWRGFSVEPAEGDCSIFLVHVRRNVCRGNDEYFQYVMAWFAQMVQRPQEKPGIALVLKGEQGTGKSKVGEVVGSLFVDHYKKVSHSRHLLGNFNAHMAGCLLAHSEEAIWAGDKRHEGVLKELITGHTMILEKKGVDAVEVPNFARLLITSNNEWVVPAAIDDRRFAVFEMGLDNQKDATFFAALDAQMDSGGREALLYYLQTFDLSSVNLRRIPQTPALLDQKLASLLPLPSWWWNSLHRGGIEAGSEWVSEVSKRRVHDAYVEHAKGVGVSRRSAETAVGRFLREFVPGLRSSRTGQGERGYVFPNLESCRVEFCRKIGHDIDWPDADEEEGHWEGTEEPDEVPF